jgi:outer membrane receptor protein involved in Fe transport
MLTLTKNFRNNWQATASYVYSKTTGTIDNVGFDAGTDSGGQDAGPSPFLDTPNSMINWNGRLTHDNTNQIKLQGTYVVAPANLWLSANWTYYTGDTYTKKTSCLLVDDDADPLTPSVCHDFPQTDVVGRVRYFAGPRGSYRLPGFNEINARMEWKPPVGKSGNLGVIVDVFNLLNYTQVTSRRDRDDGFFNQTLTYNVGRNIRVGLRYAF